MSDTRVVTSQFEEIDMALQDRLDALKADFETNKAPASVVATMHKATADLIQSGQADRALNRIGFQQQA